MKNTLLDLYEKDGTRQVLSSLISILAGLFVGAIVVVIVGLSKETITSQGIADGVKLIFAGILTWLCIRSEQNLKKEYALSKK